MTVTPAKGAGAGDASHAHERASTGRGLRAALLLGAATMTVAWLSLWLALLAVSVASPGLLPAPLQEAYALGAGLLAWRLATAPWGERAARVVFSACALLAALVSLWAFYYRGWSPLDPRWLVRLVGSSFGGSNHPYLAAAIAVLALCWTGGRIGASDLDAYDVSRFFQLGLGGLFTGLLFGSLAGAARLAPGQLGAATALFFASALLILPLAQLRAAQQRGHATGGRGAGFDRRWLPPLGSAVLAVLGAALLLSGAVSGALLSEAAALLGRLPALILALLTPLLLAAGYLLAAALALFQRLPHAARRVPHPPRAAPTPTRPLLPPPGVYHASALFSAIVTGVALVVLLAAALLLLQRTLGRRALARGQRLFEEERDSVWSWDEARIGWRALLGRLRVRRASPRRRGAQGPPRSVREAYRRLLARGAELGQARQAPETPREYLRRVRSLLLPAELDAALLTDAYQRERYADEALSPDEVERAVQAWRGVDAATAPREGGA